MLRTWILALGAIAAVPAMAQDDKPPRLINVVGVGVDRTAPDIAMLDFTMRGEGDSADAASTALATRQKALAGGLMSLLGKESDLTNGNVNIVEVRDRACDDGRTYGGTARLSRGACAVVGYIASNQAQVRTRAVDKIATAVGLAARLGASDARVTGFALADPDAAQRRAAVAAMKDARQRAETAATGAGVKLGELVSIRDQMVMPMGQDIVVSARMNAPAPPPPPPPPPPIAIDIKPRPIETRAQMIVSYAIGQ